MALSDEHIQQHCDEWAVSYLDGGDCGGGGHSGMSLGIYSGLLMEPPLRVAKILLGLRVPTDKLSTGLRTSKGWDSETFLKFVPNT